jgi:hypothetical protein
LNAAKLYEALQLHLAGLGVELARFANIAQPNGPAGNNGNAQQLLEQIERTGHNIRPALYNQLLADGRLMWLVNNEGLVPPMPRKTQRQIMRLTTGQINMLLNHYGIPVNTNLSNKRIAMLQFLGKVL